MNEPTQTCKTCGDVERVPMSGRGFPPDAAKRRLAARCKAKGHRCQAEYLAGIRFGGAITGQAATPGGI